MLPEDEEACGHGNVSVPCIGWCLDGIMCVEVCERRLYLYVASCTAASQY